MSSEHDNTAKRIAKKKGVPYTRGQGPDIESPQVVVEVETADTVNDAFRQLQGFKKPVYIAGADAKATKKALEAAKGKTAGVMNPQGKIVKRSTRKGK